MSDHNSEKGGNNDDDGGGGGSKVSFNLRSSQKLFRGPSTTELQQPVPTVAPPSTPTPLIDDLLMALPLPPQPPPTPVTVAPLQSLTAPVNNSKKKLSSTSASQGRDDDFLEVVPANRQSFTSVGSKESNDPETKTDNRKGTVSAPLTIEEGDEPPTLPTTSEPPLLPPETKEDRLWIAKLEQFVVKFFNKIFRRAESEWKLRAAVKIPGTCKIQGQFGGADPTNLSPEQSQQEEAQLAAELNYMLDEIAEVIKTVAPAYLTLITPIFGTLVELKSAKDFRTTDNREMFRKVDDYEVLIKCDSHICLNSVTARVYTLVEFINGIKSDVEALRKFPRIITRCYSTESKICQEICEVYSDDNFQTVNIKKMCKLKQKAPERPPWRLSYKTGNECYPSREPPSCEPAPPSTKGGGACPPRGGTCGGGGGSKFNKSCSIADCAYPSLEEHRDKCKTLRRFVSALNHARSPRPQTIIAAPCRCGCGCCCNRHKKVPEICGILYTRYRANNLDPDECPLTVDGYGTGETTFPSITNFRNIRVLNHPGNRQFVTRCENPPRTRENCFGTGVKWNKQFPGNRNTCCQESCRPNRDRASCSNRCRNGSSRSRLRRMPPGGRGGYGRDEQQDFTMDCTTSTTELCGGAGGAGGVQGLGAMGPTQFRSGMGAIYDNMAEQAETRMNRGLSSGLAEETFRACATGQGYNMTGRVATQTMGPNTTNTATTSWRYENEQGQGPKSTSKSTQNHTANMAHCQDFLHNGFQRISQQGKCIGAGESLLNSTTKNKIPSVSKQEFVDLITKCFGGDGSTIIGSSMLPQSVESKEVFNSFIAQMQAAGKVSKEDAERMMKLVNHNLVLNSGKQFTDACSGGPVCINDGCPKGLRGGSMCPPKPRCTVSRVRKNKGTCTENPSHEKCRHVVCNPKSQASIMGVTRCPTSTLSKPACTRKSRPAIPGVPTCFSKAVCTTESIPGMPKCAPPSPPKSPPVEEPLPDDEEIPPAPEEFQDPTPPESARKSSTEPLPPDEDPEPTPDVISEKAMSMSEKTVSFKEESIKSMSSSARQPSSSSHPSSPEATPPRTPSNNNSPVKEASPVPSESGGEIYDDDESLEWPKSPKQGPFDKTKRPSKPGKNYKSPFKFKQIKAPEPPCEIAMAELPECHPLKTPYPPQYRYNEVKLRRYMQQCGLLQQVCSKKGQANQCYIPTPPVPLISKYKFDEFPPPDKCAYPPLFPNAKMGAGCSTGLPGGNNYYPFNPPQATGKTDDCFFDCGGMCPMGMLGESCPSPSTPPPYSKLKKKKKEDETFMFDYITVRREKSAPEAEKDYCELYKEKLKEKEDACVDYDEYDECGGGRYDYCGVDNGPPPSDEITRFLQRKDVQVVKEQKTEIVKKHTDEGPERLVTQMETYYTKAPDGTITAEQKDPSINTTNNNYVGVEQWVRDDVDKEMKKLQKAYRTTTDECPKVKTEWEKEFKEFEMSCNKPKNKARPKPPLPGFLPCPLPENTPLMCRKPAFPTKSGKILCQAIPFPRMMMAQQGQDGGGGTYPYGGAIAPAVPGLFSMPPPPGGYGGYVLQHQMAQVAPFLPIPQQPPQQQQEQVTVQLAQTQNQMPQQLSNDPSGVTAIMQPIHYTSAAAAAVQSMQYNPSGVVSSMKPIKDPSAGTTAIMQPSTQFPSSGFTMQLKQDVSGISTTKPTHDPSVGVTAIMQPIQFPSGVATTQPTKYPSKIPANSSQQESRQLTVNQTDYPYMCEIRYHEPIHGSIYGRVVTRRQPCRLIDPENQDISTAGGGRDCPVIMETPFFNPSCPQKKKSQKTTTPSKIN